MTPSKVSSCSSFSSSTSNAFPTTKLSNTYSTITKLANSQAEVVTNSPTTWKHPEFKDPHTEPEVGNSSETSSQDFLEATA